MNQQTQSPERPPQPKPGAGNVFDKVSLSPKALIEWNRLLHSVMDGQHESGIDPYDVSMDEVAYEAVDGSLVAMLVAIQEMGTELPRAEIPVGYLIVPSEEWRWATDDEEGDHDDAAGLDQGERGDHQWNPVGALLEALPERFKSWENVLGEVMLSDFAIRAWVAHCLMAVFGEEGVEFDENGKALVTEDTRAELNKAIPRESAYEMKDGWLMLCGQTGDGTPLDVGFEAVAALPIPPEHWHWAGTETETTGVVH